MVRAGPLGSWRPQPMDHAMSLVWIAYSLAYLSDHEPSTKEPRRYIKDQRPCGDSRQSQYRTEQKRLTKLLRSSQTGSESDSSGVAVRRSRNS